MDYLEAILNAACLWQMVGGPSGVVKLPCSFGAFQEQGISGGGQGPHFGYSRDGGTPRL
jgi:hypothetical protein